MKIILEQVLAFNPQTRSLQVNEKKGFTRKGQRTGATSGVRFSDTRYIQI